MTQPQNRFFSFLVLFLSLRWRVVHVYLTNFEFCEHLRFVYEICTHCWHLNCRSLIQNQEEFCLYLTNRFHDRFCIPFLWTSLMSYFFSMTTFVNDKKKKSVFNFLESLSLVSILINTRDLRQCRNAGSFVWVLWQIFVSICVRSFEIEKKTSQKQQINKFYTRKLCKTSSK